MFIIQELSGHRAEGENRVGRVRELSDKVLLETAPTGQTQISRDVSGLTHDWQTFLARLNTTQVAQQTACDSWEEFDQLSDSLSTWLRDTELQLNDQQLKSTLADKQNQLAQFKVWLLDLLINKVQKPASCNFARINDNIFNFLLLLMYWHWWQRALFLPLHEPCNKTYLCLCP